MTPATSRTPTSPEVFRRIRSGYDALTPELQRAAQWVVDHPGETGFLSMRQQARSAGPGLLHFVYCFSTIQILR